MLLYIYYGFCTVNIYYTSVAMYIRLNAQDYMLLLVTVYIVYLLCTFGHSD